jgi:Spy/CpxP family protein refolding chaperone
MLDQTNETMKTHLKIAAVAIALVVGLFSSSLSAQQEPPPPPPPGEGHGCGRNPQEFFLAMLIEKLSLTQVQQTKVIAILADEKAAMDALRTSGQTADHETMRTQAESIIKAHRAQIRVVLTTEQQKLFDEMKPDRHGPPPPPPGDGTGPE